MNTIRSLDNALLLAYIIDDASIIEAIQRLQGHLNKAMQDLEHNKIRANDLQTTEIGVLNKIRSIFSPQNTVRIHEERESYPE
jgi:hypothetical protein